MPTSFMPSEPAVRQLLAKTADMPTTMIAERVGWAGSTSWFRDNVRRVRPAVHFRFMVGRPAECQGFDHAAHAGELCWSSSHLAELLGQPDKRPPSLHGALTVPGHALWTDG
ncbi:hypothetical protein [Kribbella jiaozuonensis]|uniref:Uncharacterized protein n=1 Tax=Kribbella jiaozuonensis TaxID=2575441 RepID=A0A4U3LNL7_9ACTN|nr:hypothetical protein [Kribbella jiaozuonensis]TKK76086.1 hypothetical protein FDA38_27060 [Kribbella jiaozuonensis]